MMFTKQVSAVVAVEDDDAHLEANSNAHIRECYFRNLLGFTDMHAGCMLHDG